jgi:hypothetical protein
VSDRARSKHASVANDLIEPHAGFKRMAGVMPATRGRQASRRSLLFQHSITE